MILCYSNSPSFPVTHQLRSLSHSLLVAPAWGAAGRRVSANTRCFGHLAWVGAAGGCHQAIPHTAPRVAGCPAPRFPGSNPWHSAFQGCYQAKECRSHRARSCGGAYPMGGPGGRAVGCPTHRNVNGEPRRLYAGMDLCSPWYYSANPYPQGTGSGEGVPFAVCI